MDGLRALRASPPARFNEGPLLWDPVPPRSVPLLHVQRGHFVAPDGAGGWKPAFEPAKEIDHARRLFEAADSLYVIDLDSQAAGVANLDFYQTLERKRVFPWLDVGARKVEDVMDAFFAGAESITVQLRHMPPDDLEEVGGLAEADFYVGVTMERNNLEKGLRPADLVGLAERVAATGIVLYEGADGDLHSAENVALELQKVTIPTVWVARPGSPQTERARRSERLAAVVAPEGGA